MNSSCKPLHLAERAARHLLEVANNEPEMLLLQDSFASETGTLRSSPASSASSAGPDGPCLAVQTLEKAGMIAARGKRDRIVEEFRVIGQRVLSTITSTSVPARQRNLVMITSVHPGEGKSMVALNLAATLALVGTKRVILADANIEPNSLTEEFDLESHPGVLDVAASPAEGSKACLVGSPIRGLSFLPVGGGTDADGRALISAHHPTAGLMRTLANGCADALIVVDAPPCLASSDPAGLAAVVGQTVLVVEAGKTHRREIEAALDMIDACHNISLLLNKLAVSSQGAFGVSS